MQMLIVIILVLCNLILLPDDSWRFRGIVLLDRVINFFFFAKIFVINCDLLSLVNNLSFI